MYLQVSTEGYVFSFYCVVVRKIGSKLRGFADFLSISDSFLNVAPANLLHSTPSWPSDGRRNASVVISGPIVISVSLLVGGMIWYLRFADIVSLSASTSFAKSESANLPRKDSPAWRYVVDILRLAQQSCARSHSARQKSFTSPARGVAKIGSVISIKKQKQTDDQGWGIRNIICYNFERPNRSVKYG